MTDRKISIVGIGKLGMPMTACFASKGYDVIGVDVNPEIVRKVNEGISPVFEPHLDDLFRNYRGRIKATVSFEEAISNSSQTFLIVPTPSEGEGGFSLKYVLSACEKIGKALAAKKDFHLLVLTSTVLPGATAGEVVPCLEKHSGKKCGADFGLCYNPEFIALGSVIRDILNPDFVLIGESDPRSGDTLEAFYRTICENNAPITRMNWVNAEITKIAVNTFVTTKISYANMIAEICERLPNADAEVVTRALGMDTRIGKKYLKGALGYGGPCFPRDNIAFSFMSGKLGVKAAIAEATDAINRRQLKRLEEKVLSELPSKGIVGVMGLAYKPGTNVIERSQGFELVQNLVSKSVPLVLYDPFAMENVRGVLGGQVMFATSARDCARRVSVLVVTIPCEEFKEIVPEDLKRSGAEPLLIDCWRLFDPAKFKDVCRYVAMGTGK
ncbi:MAG TPA: nucleotide sugar dehydrogenase [Candidatus Omnitrophota bacterium]|nr:nucleotide sugar dehydrogenase [Candidatus Omnitrophota bacterium]